MIERQRERNPLSGGPLVMVELPPPTAQQATREEELKPASPAADAAHAKSQASPSISTPQQAVADGADTHEQRSMSRREWTLMRIQQMANLRGQVLYDATWMSAEEARRLHRRKCFGSLIISAELLVLLAAGAVCAWFIHQVLSSLTA